MPDLLHFEDFRPGQTLPLGTHVLTAEEVIEFARARHAHDGGRAVQPCDLDGFAGHRRDTMAQAGSRRRSRAAGWRRTRHAPLDEAGPRLRAFSLFDDS